MATYRDILKLGGGHPFYERMVVLRNLFDHFEEIEKHSGGVIQDTEIELRAREAKGELSEYEVESAMEYE